MTTSSLTVERTPTEAAHLNRLRGAALALNAVIMTGAIWLALTIIRLPVDQFGNLGTPVQWIVAALLMIPVIAGGFSCWHLLRDTPSGRYSAFALQFIAAVLCGIAVLHLWKVFYSFEDITDVIMANAWMTLGYPLAYVVYWVAERFDERSIIRLRLEQATGGVVALTTIALILRADLLGAANSVLESYADPLTWAMTLGMIGCATLALLTLRTGDYYGETHDQRAAWQGWLMLSPNLFGFTLFMAGPLLLSLYLSFTDSSVGRVPEVIGLANYADLFALELRDVPADAPNIQSVLSFGYTELMTFDLPNGRRMVVGAEDALFWRSLRNTLVYCLMLVPLAVIPALGLSLILNSKLPGVKFFRALYFLPSVAAVVGTALIWRWLYDPVIGYINYLLGQVMDFLGGEYDPVLWLTDPGVMLFSVVLLGAWQVVGFNTVLFLAGLQGIPRDLYEAATVDGANRWGQFWYITLPMLSPTTFFVIITTIITGLQVFNEPYALFPTRPMPAEATTGVFYLYNRGFFGFEFGYASAIAWVMFALIFLVTLLQFRLSRSNAYE